MSLYIFDMDGVIADVLHRQPLADTGDWDSFFEREAILKDAPIKGVIDIIKNLNQSEDSKVYILTARPERTREATIYWLSKWDVPYARLIMRPDGDSGPGKRSAAVWKSLVLKTIISMNEEITLFVDDNLKNCKAAEAIGVPTMHMSLPGWHRGTNSKNHEQHYTKNGKVVTQ